MDLLEELTVFPQPKVFLDVQLMPSLPLEYTHALLAQIQQKLLFQLH